MTRWPSILLVFRCLMLRMGGKPLLSEDFRCRWVRFRSVVWLSLFWVKWVVSLS